MGVAAAAWVAAAVPAGAATTRSQLAFRCPAPVPIVGDVRRTQVDELFFAVMRRAEEAGRMPVQADVDAALLQDGSLIAEAQQDTYTKPNVLLYTLHPSGRPGFRAGFYTTQTWGYTIEQRTLDQAPLITDSEATFRRTGGDLVEVGRAMNVARGWRVAATGGLFPAASQLVADMLHRGVNEGRVTAIGATGTPRTGWIGVWVSADHDHALVRGRTCSKLIDMRDDAGVLLTAAAAATRAPAPARCPANVTVPAVERRRVRRIFDTAMETALLAGRPSPDAGDVSAALATVGVTATDVTTTARADLPADGIVYELDAGRFAVARLIPGGGVARIEWLGIDLPVVTTITNTAVQDAVAGFRWQLDRVAASLHRVGKRYRPARLLARRPVAGVTVPIIALRAAHGTPLRGRAGIWVSPDRRLALARGGVCAATYTSYART